MKSICLALWMTISKYYNGYIDEEDIIALLVILLLISIFIYEWKFDRNEEQKANAILNNQIATTKLEISQDNTNQPHYCVHCGAKVLTESNFCRECGKQIK